MIALGLTPAERADLIADVMRERGLRRVFAFMPERFALPGWSRIDEPVRELDGAPGRYIDWPKVIFYTYYYPLLQTITSDSLVVVHEGLRTQNRHDLAYNCLRNYLNLTPHVLVLQTLPIIAEPIDAMILIDWVTRSKWKREPFAPHMLDEVQVVGRALRPTFEALPVTVDTKTRAAYEATKAKLLAELRSDGDRDPHNLPRQLALIGGRARKAAIGDAPYLARNARLGGDVATFADVADARPRALLELPHNFIQYADALAVTRQEHARVAVTDLKVDGWYFDRYTAWAGRVADAATALHG